MDDLSLEMIWQANISAVTAMPPGTYQVSSAAYKTGNTGYLSYPFDVGADVYQNVGQASLKMFYWQRCGVAKVEPHSLNWTDNIPCHLDENATTAHSGNTVDVGPLELTGGWHDAGDMNSYLWQATLQAVWGLFRAYELNPGAWPDGTTGYTIPESGNGLPDILDHVIFELEWILKMQVRACSIAMMAAKNACGTVDRWYVLLQEGH
jgi:endoglucanase